MLQAAASPCIHAALHDCRAQSLPTTFCWEDRHKAHQRSGMHTDSKVLCRPVQEFHPYVFQIFAQLIELRPIPLPDIYLNVFPPLLSPIFWERPANIPPLVRLLQAYLCKAGKDLVQRGHLQVHRLRRKQSTLSHVLPDTPATRAPSDRLSRSPLLACRRPGFV